MFLTITIDTNRKKKSKVRLHKKKINAAKGWRTTLHFKKIGFWQRVRRWRRSIAPARYRLGEQRVMF